MPPFARKLIDWYAHAHRPLPWRDTADPWAILVSEIMLQQTRASVVIPYWQRFLERYPTPPALAVAPEQELLTMWSGLGYYSRARNLQKAAQAITDAGGFQPDYDFLRALPGVGDYTAAAVASIAFGLQHAVLDGNVMRVAARLTNDAGDIGAGVTKKRLQAAVDQLIPAPQPGLFNQAMMELGATLCVPRQPQCLLCPVAGFCEGRKAGRAGELPVKLRRAVPIREERTLLIVERERELLLWQRPVDADRLAGFWELPEASQLPKAVLGENLGTVRHSIVNHSYTITVYLARLPRPLPGKETQLKWIKRNQLAELPVSTTSRKAIQLWDKGRES
ncbi:MAG: A/G-specific adenine glycosylase [Acidobacteria bacterium]|nr:A/G-specific adenine glycosylase [Acidobacteriota bacterium]